jgi:hypothetical protein
VAAFGALTPSRPSRIARFGLLLVSDRLRRHASFKNDGKQKDWRSYWVGPSQIYFKQLQKLINERYDASIDRTQPIKLWNAYRVPSAANRNLIKKSHWAALCGSALKSYDSALLQAGLLLPCATANQSWIELRATGSWKLCLSTQSAETDRQNRGFQANSELSFADPVSQVPESKKGFPQA